MNEVAAPAAPVAIIMGSDSDWPTMAPAADVLRDFGIASSVDVVSAHRMPRQMVEFAAGAAGRGVGVIIAGAGGAAHLPGMVAAVTYLPVIGVPVPLEHLDGVDSLLSILQMPKGVPVATVSIGGAANAGLLAARILAAGDGTGALSAETLRLRAALADYQDGLRAQAEAKGAALRERLVGEG